MDILEDIEAEADEHTPLKILRTVPEGMSRWGTV
jgi:hypothetical protein